MKIKAAGVKDDYAGNKWGSGCCRCPFSESVAAQIYYPANPNMKQKSYPLMRHGVLAHLSEALQRSLWSFKLFGVHRAMSPAVAASPVAKVSPAGAGFPVVLLSHGLFGNCDLHSVLGDLLARLGYITICLEHEDGSASFCRPLSKGGEVVSYHRPPAKPAKTHLEYLENVRSFRMPQLEKRVEEVAAVLRALQGGSAEPLVGRTGMPFERRSRT